VDGNGNQLQAGDVVKLRGKSQYEGQFFSIESTDVGDGRVRVCLQLSATAVTRMAFDPQHLEKVTAEAQQMQSDVQYVVAGGEVPVTYVQQ
jgi:hypothetical protein